MVQAENILPEKPFRRRMYVSLLNGTFLHVITSLENCRSASESVYSLGSGLDR